VRALTLGLSICLLVACGGPPPGGAGDAFTPPVPKSRSLAIDSSVDGVGAATEGAESTAATQPHDAGPADSDGDGVPDADDACPGTKPGLEVDETGCPVDADADGVRGAADLCPDSPYGEPVDEHGCRPRLAVAQEFTLLLNFEPNSTKVIGDPRAALAEVAALITQYPETTVVIEGHTDDRGAAKYNLKMSQMRAEAVAQVLVQDLGIDAARVSTKGFGKSRPIATNATKEGRERNRRVVAVVLPGPAPGQSQTTTTAQAGAAG